jgi:very-short-patch-repair endonuclease
MNSRYGVTVRYDFALPPKANVFVDSVPVTRISKTLLGLCSVLSTSAAMDAVVDAVRRKVVTLPDLGRVLDDASEQRGGRSTLRKILTSRFAVGVTDSDAEDLFLTMARRRGFEFLHHHVVSLGSSRGELDFARLPSLLDIEIDGSDSHDDPVAVQRDKNRDAELVARGWVVLRFTYWDLIQRTDWVFATIDEVLAQRERLRHI